MEPVGFTTVAERLAWRLVLTTPAKPRPVEGRRCRRASETASSSRAGRASGDHPSPRSSGGSDAIRFPCRWDCDRPWRRVRPRESARPGIRQHRQIRFNCVLDQAHLVAQPRIALGLIDAHRSAQHHQAARPFHAGGTDCPSFTCTYCHASAAPSNVSAISHRFSTG